MTIPIYQVDAFSDKPYAGNPAAVMPLWEWLRDEEMQQIAMENNLSETAFFVPLSPDEMLRTGADYHVRWFTPTTEVDLCGHATIATAMIIDQVLQLDVTTHEVNFITEKAGLLRVQVDDGWYTLELPAREPEPCNTPPGLLEALGLTDVVRVMRSRDYFVVVDSELTVANLSPDFEALKKLDGFGVIVTAPGEVTDAVSRCFYPRAGVNEDPVTGSAHCNLIPYWSQQLGKKELVCRQISARGGTLICADKGDRVWMSGKCTLFMKGEVYHA